MKNSGKPVRNPTELKIGIINLWLTQPKTKSFVWKKREVKSSQLSNTVGNIDNEAIGPNQL